MAAARDIVSGGRLELGIGAGWNEEECAAYGIELEPMTERFDRFDEACEIILSLVADKTSDQAGRHYRLTAARCREPMSLRTAPPLYGRSDCLP